LTTLYKASTVISRENGTPFTRENETTYLK